MSDKSMGSMSMPELYDIFHSTPYIWWATAFLGLCWGLYRYGRSLKYLYYYYIETGEVIWTMESRSRREKMEEVGKRYNLSEFFTPHGYVSGLGIMVTTTIIGYVTGVFYPISIIIGILTIPNIVLRFAAREKRAKVVFHQKLKEKQDASNA